MYCLFHCVLYSSHSIITDSYCQAGHLILQCRTKPCTFWLHDQQLSSHSYSPVSSDLAGHVRADSDSAEDIIEDSDVPVDEEEEEDEDEEVLVDEDQMQNSVCTLYLKA